MSEIMSCPSCNAKFGGMFNSNQLKSKDLTESLNFILNRKNEHYCNECAKSPIEEVKSVLENNKHTFREKIKEGISSVPTISIQAPPKWDFDVIGLVTGQSTTGTGILSELTSSFTDLFGTQSKTYNTKLKAGEDLCLAQIRNRALELGANAIVGIDIDYAEVGGEKGMLMVCMTGTAIKLKNINELFEYSLEKISKIEFYRHSLSVYEKFERTHYL